MGRENDFFLNSNYPMTRLALFLCVNNIPLLMYLKVSIDGLKELVAYINTDEFKAEYGNVYIIPKRLNQDIVESFFSSQRQMCGGSRNMTAFTYGYNVNGLVAFRSSKLIKNKQTNVYEVEECFHLAQSNQHLPRRVGHTNLDVTWTVEL